MAIGMGEPKEKVRAMMIEVKLNPHVAKESECANWGENDTSSRKSAGGSRLSAHQEDTVIYISSMSAVLASIREYLERGVNAGAKEIS
jgi:hypothetical protein